MTYSEAYNKIIDAYFKDEIRTFDSHFCFCGTLSHDSSWFFNDSASRPYSFNEYNTMEAALFSKIKWVKRNGPADLIYDWGRKPTEDELFSGMCAALEVLKEIHRARGENVDEVPEFKKRHLKALP